MQLDSSESLDSSQRRARCSVQLEDLLAFVFPPHLQHPLSLGRLYAFALHGPLDEHNQLRGGARRSRVLSSAEVDSMCKAFEREDVLRVYLHEGRALHTLTAAQQDELIAQADSKLKKGSKRGTLKQPTKQEVIELFEGLPTDEGGGFSYHDLQRRIEEYRERRVADAKVVFPLMSKPTTATEASASKTRALTRTHHNRGRRKPGRKTGMTDIEARADEARLLARNAFKVCELETSNEPGIISNLRLMRRDEQKSATVPATAAASKRAQWDTTSCLNGTQIGSRVRCIPCGPR